MSFERIRDQEVALRLLRNVLRLKRIPNGLLFWGPGGIGKRMTALEMAKAVNCPAMVDDACDECLSCRKIMHGNHPDVKIIIPSKKSRLINLETVSEVTAMATLRPFESSWRIVIIEDADRMTPPAQNHLLKTLEEPPGNSLFILTSEYPRVLLPTIRSRCQMVRFRTLYPSTVAEILLDERDLPRELAESVSVLAQGQMTRALDLLESEKREVVLHLVDRLANGDDPAALADEFAELLDSHRKRIKDAVEAGMESDPNMVSRDEREVLKEERLASIDALYKRDMMEHLYLLAAWYRDVLVFSCTAEPSRVLNRDQLDRLKAHPVHDNAGDKVAAIDQARRYLDRYISEDRVFRDLFFTLAGQ